MPIFYARRMIFGIYLLAKGRMEMWCDVTFRLGADQSDSPLCYYSYCTCPVTAAEKLGTYKVTAKNWKGDMRRTPQELLTAFCP